MKIGFPEELDILIKKAPPPLDHGDKGKDDGSEASSAIVVDEMGTVTGNQTAAKDHAPPKIYEAELNIFSDKLPPAMLLGKISVRSERSVEER